MTKHSLNPFEENTSSNEQTLKEAFPTIDVRVINDVLLTVNGKLQDAFDCLLNISDPSSTHNITTTDGGGGSTSKQLPPAPGSHQSQRRDRGCRNSSSSSSSCSNQRITPSRRGCSDNNNPFLNGNTGSTSIRQDLAQWREQLAEESRQRRQYAKEHWRTSHSSVRSFTPSTFSSTGSTRNRYSDTNGGLGDAISHLIEAGKNAALSKANTALAAAVNEANTSLENSRFRGAVYSHNTSRRYQSESNLNSSTATIGTLTTTPMTTAPSTPTITPVPASIRPTPPRPSSTNTIRNNNIPVDRNRPLPTPPQHTASTSSINPFDPMISLNDEPPPPSYEAHINDRYIEPCEIDRVIQSTAQVSRSM